MLWCCRWGGVKFCTLRRGKCSFFTHSKKVEVVAGAIYISTGRNSAFTHHHAPTGLLSDGQVQELLKETHTKDHWIRLLRSLSQASAEEASHGLKAGKRTTSASVIDTVTPVRKRRVRYESEAGTGTLFNTPAMFDGSRESLRMTSSSFPP